MENNSRQQLARTYAPAVLQRLEGLPTKDQLPIAAWLIKTPVGTNYALQILSHLSDLARRKEQSLSQCLTQTLSQLGEIPTQPKEVGRQVRDHLLGELKPESTAHREAYSQWLNELALPQGVQLHPPKNFEGKQFRLELHFQSFEDLARKVNGLVKSLKERPWEEIENF